MAFKEMDIHELQFNPFDKISRQWMLVTAGDRMKSNTMTASWGGVGIMWGKPVVTAYIRPQRYTKEFVDGSDRFTISFLPGDKREALNISLPLSTRLWASSIKKRYSPFIPSAKNRFRRTFGSKT